jgi:RNA polymerase sigma-70 factor (ECF subfamily)
MLRARKARREEPLAAHVPDPIVSRAGEIDPEDEALLADSVGLALLVVLERLAPAERLAFVLHDLFAVPFEEIAPIVGRSPAAARQLACRARRRVQGAAPGSRGGTQRVPASGPPPGAGAGAPSGPAVAAKRHLARQRAVVDAFLAAARGGDFNALLALLDPDVVFRADNAAVKAGASREARGAQAVAAGALAGARSGPFAQPALVNGAVGVVVAPRGRLLMALSFTITRGKIVKIDAVADPARLRQLDLAVLND